MAALEALAGFDHLQEVILQNFVPHRRYYGEEPAEIADGGGRALLAHGLRERRERDRAGVGDAGHDRRHGAAGREARRLMPEVGIQMPPNLADWWPRARRRGRDRPRRAERQRRPHLARAPVPVAAPGPQAAGRGRRRADRAAVRLPAVHRPRVDGPGRARRRSRRVLELHPARGSGRTRRPRSARLVGRRDRAGARRRGADAEELTALFAETRPEAIEDMRQAADELRAELAGDTVTFVVNRNINVSNVCIVGCAFCGFGQGKRSPDAYEHDARRVRRRVDEAVDYGATELCMQSGIHPDWALEDYLGWLRLRQGDRAAAAPARVLADGDRAHVRRLRAAAGRGLRAAARGRAGLDAGHRRRGAARRRARADQPEQAAGRALGRDHRGRRTAPACARR